MTTKKSTKKPARKAAKKSAVKKVVAKVKKAVKKAVKAVSADIKNGGDKPTVTITRATEANFADLLKDAPVWVSADRQAEGVHAETVQAVPVEIPPGAHAEEQLAIQQGNKQYEGEMRLRSEGSKAIVSVDVPAHQKDVVLAESMIPGCALATVQAWDAMRNPDDAPFVSCVVGHRMKLVSHAESIYRGGSPMSGDTALARFEREVARIKSEQDKEKQ